MAERRRGREAGLAGVDVLAIFAGEPGEVEDLDLDPVDAANLRRDLGQPPALRHLAGAGMLGARRAVYDEDAGRLRPGPHIPPEPWSIASCAAIQSIGEVVIGIGEARPGLARCAATCGCSNSRPRRRRRPLELGLRAARRRDRRYCALKRRLNSASSSSTGGIPLRGSGARPNIYCGRWLSAGCCGAAGGGVSILMSGSSILGASTLTLMSTSSAARSR